MIAGAPAAGPGARAGRVAVRQEHGVDILLSWRHPGFSVFQGSRLSPDDPEARERLARYCVHPPIALVRLHYDRETRQLTYDPDQIVELGMQIVDALDAAHAEGIVHRDTKRPLGDAIPIHHLHGTSRRLSSNPGDIGLKVARDKIAFAVEESRGNVWMLEPAASSQR